MIFAYWSRAFLLAWLLRVAQLGALYFCAAPQGRSLVDRWYRFFPHALLAETGVLATLALAFAAFHRLSKGHRLPAWGWWGASSLLLLLAGADDETMRWMGQHLTLDFLKTYVNLQADTQLVGRVFGGGLWHFSLSIALILLYMILGARLVWRRGNASAGLGMLVLLAVLAGTGLSSRYWMAPSKSRWERIRPVALTLLENYRYAATHEQKPLDYAKGIALLGGDALAPYPFWHKEKSEDSLMEAFRQRPLEQRPDVVLLVIESLRGWSSDIRVDSTCALLPTICALARSGVYFPNAHSVGYPSVEGLLGVQAGVWSHPEKMSLVNRRPETLRPLPEILGKAGYYREVLTATEPSFDNLQPWFSRWFDYSEYRAENSHDVPLARRFAERYASMPAGRPLYLTWMSTTTHLPFTMPEGYGEDPADLTLRYKRVLAYMDSAVGMVLQTIRQGGRANRTIIVLTGDHAVLNQGQNARAEELGAIQEGHVWVPLIVAGAGVPASQVHTRPVSQVDIAPTLMKLLNLRASNHFVGRDLLGNTPSAPVFAFRQQGILFKRDSLLLSASADDTSHIYASRSLLYPIWNTAELVEGFVSGPPLQYKPDPAIYDSMRAAARAWSYVLDHDLLCAPSAP